MDVLRTQGLGRAPLSANWSDKLGISSGRPTTELAPAQQPSRTKAPPIACPAWAGEAAPSRANAPPAACPPPALIQEQDISYAGACDAKARAANRDKEIEESGGHGKRVMDGSWVGPAS